VAQNELSISEIGEGIRRARLKANVSLSDVAKGTGVSPSFLSLVENGKSDISLGRLARLTDFLGLNLSDLIDPPQESRFQVMRRNERPSLNLGQGVSTDFLPHSQGFQRRIMAFEPGGSLDVSDYQMTARGESFYLVMKGQLGLELVGLNSLRLKAGDSIALRHQDFRRSWNEGRQVCVVYVESQFGKSDG
jgi:transcriptional regulator with XRE-family HTH domain